MVHGLNGLNFSMRCGMYWACALLSSDLMT